MIEIILLLLYSFMLFKSQGVKEELDFTGFLLENCNWKLKVYITEQIVAWYESGLGSMYQWKQMEK